MQYVQCKVLYYEGERERTRDRERERENEKEGEKERDGVREREKERDGEASSPLSVLVWLVSFCRGQCVHGKTKGQL